MWFQVVSGGFSSFQVVLTFINYDIYMTTVLTIVFKTTVILSLF